VQSWVQSPVPGKKRGVGDFVQIEKEIPYRGKKKKNTMVLSAQTAVQYTQAVGSMS
jgi:hypothetical protein